MTHARDDRGGYAVGYGKPPLHSRFRKGRSGNPRGRSRGSTPLAQLLQQALDETVLVPKGHGRRRITKREAIVAGLVDRALQADPRATRLLLDLMLKTQHDEAFDQADPDDAEDPREYLIRELDRLVAENEQAQEEVLGSIKPPANEALVEGHSEKGKSG